MELQTDVNAAPVHGIVRLPAWILFGFFFVYGVVRFMDDTGIVFRHDGEAFFWFEPQLVEWIYGK